MRLARELHDVAAHHVSVIAVQAEAGQALLPQQPERGRPVLERIADSAREALGDLRRLLGVLAAEDDAVPTEPGAAARPRGLPPGRACRQAGVPVELRIEGAAPLDAAVDCRPTASCRRR